MKRKGKVFLVGAGPGDPGLVTVKAVERLRQADVVVYDALVNETLLDLSPPISKKIYVGKRGSHHSLEQGAINRLLIREARKGRRVVRLKGGDPFLFGRGGEEAEALVRAGVPYEVIPGVTSAIAAPAYAGIPVTHRDCGSTVTFITGHQRADGQPSDIDWQALAGLDTVVFLMAAGNLVTISGRLIAAGLPPERPAAMIAWGTLPRQRTATGTIATIANEARRLRIEAPAVLVVGRVATLRRRLAWFEKRPLFGRRILVTRSREQASALSSRLEELGAEVIEIPTIEIRPPSNFSGLDLALRKIRQFDWILFTSTNGVEAFFERLKYRRLDLRALAGIKLGAIGPATAEAVAGRGLRVDLLPTEFVAEGVLRRLGNQKPRGARILIPRARKAREVLVTGLKKLGAKITVVEAYQTGAPHGSAPVLRRVLNEGLDLITFASSSTVDNFMGMIGRDRTLLKKIRRVPVASIGPITTRTARCHRLRVKVQPRSYTIPALVEAILKYF